METNRKKGHQRRILYIGWAGAAVWDEGTKGSQYIKCRANQVDRSHFMHTLCAVKDDNLMFANKTRREGERYSMRLVYIEEEGYM